MRVLAFDCAGAQCSAALLADSEIVAEGLIEAERGHAQLLVPLLIDVLAEAGLQFGDIDRFAVTTGPGSFTGIRVALATAHGLAIGTGKPIIGVTVFEALAAATAKQDIASPRLLVAVESRRAECFVQLFNRDTSPLGEPAMVTPEAIAAWAGPGPLALAGDAAWRMAPHLPQAEGATGPARIDPAIIARLAATREAGAPPKPFYIRSPDAIPSRDLRQRQP
jgi:tRNA threonylcarbamoyladenosine biosynthesis protein TsaB